MIDVNPPKTPYSFAIMGIIQFPIGHMVGGLYGSNLQGKARVISQEELDERITVKAISAEEFYSMVTAITLPLNRTLVLNVCLYG